MRKASLLLLALLLAPPLWAQKDGVDAAVNETLRKQADNARSQDRIDRLDDATRAALEKYRATVWQTQQLNVYAEQLDALLASQSEDKQSLQRQIDELAVTEREILPLMLRMVDALEKFVALDLPFLKAERQERIEGLRRALSDPEAGVAETFQRVLEAYRIEIDYGRSLGAERAEVNGTVVDVLRVGRTALFYLSLDGSDAGRWDAQAGQWRPLERRYVADLRQGLRIARETAAADLLVLPMPTAGSAR